MFKSGAMFIQRPVWTRKFGSLLQGKSDFSRITLREGAPTAHSLLYASCLPKDRFGPESFGPLLEGKSDFSRITLREGAPTAHSLLHASYQLCGGGWGRSPCSELGLTRNPTPVGVVLGGWGRTTTTFSEFEVRVNSSF